MKSARQHLALATISFTLCFAAWGLISAFAPRFRTLFALSATQTALLVAVPVLLGSLARIPMGMLTDRFGGRVVFSLLMLAAPSRRFWCRERQVTANFWESAFFLAWRAPPSPWASDMFHAGVRKDGREVFSEFTAWAISASRRRYSSVRFWRQ